MTLSKKVSIDLCIIFNVSLPGISQVVSTREIVIESVGLVMVKENILFGLILNTGISVTVYFFDYFGLKNKLLTIQLQRLMLFVSFYPYNSSK